MKFSIIIPTYNRAGFIKKAIHSVINQSYPNWELIIVDDGSTDRTRDIVTPYLSQKIKYVYQINAERCAARNNGVRNASGDFVFFLDSDDYLLPEYLRELKLLISENPNSKLFHLPYLLESEDGKLHPGPNLKNIQTSIFKQNKFACQVAVERKVALDFPFWEDASFKIGEDWLFILKIISRFPFSVGKEALGRIVQHDNRTMDAPKIKTLTYSKQAFLTEVKRDKKLNKNIKLIKRINLEFDYLIILSKFYYSEPKKNLLNFIMQNPSILFTRRFLAIIKKSLFG